MFYKFINRIYLSAVSTFLTALTLSAQQHSFDSLLVQASMKLDIVYLGSETRVLIVPFCKKPLPGVSFVHVHEDESTSIDAATSFLDSIGSGCVVTLKHGMGRNISFSINKVVYKFDPNRIFTPVGRKITLAKFGAYSDSAFRAVTELSDRIIGKYIDTNNIVVALHNNTNEGGLSIKSYQKGGAYASDAERVYVSKSEDPDDFFYTVSDQAFHFFRKKGFNVMLQSNKNVVDDGSLSVYAGNKNIDYINIEAEHGKIEQQKKMLSATMQYIKEFYPSQSVQATKNEHH